MPPMSSHCMRSPAGLPKGEVWPEAGLSLDGLDEGLLLGEGEVGLPGEFGESRVLCPGDFPGGGLRADRDALGKASAMIRMQ